MKTSTSTAFLAICLSFVACGESAEARELRDAVGGTVDAAKKLAEKTIADVQRDAQPMLDDAQKQFGELKQKLESGGQQVTAEVREAAARAQQELADAKQAFEKAKAAGADSAEQAWKHFQEALVKARQSLQEAAGAVGK
jgi:exonuclease VII large subunit